MPTHNFHTPKPVRVEVAIAAGEIRIATHDTEESTVTLDGSSKLAEALRVELLGDRLVIQQRRKSLLGFFERRGEPIQITASVPHSSSATIATAAGEAVLDGTFAGLRLKSASGGLAATGEVHGPVVVESVSGDVRLPRLVGDLTTRTVSGDVEAEAITGSVTARSVSGDVRIGSLGEGVLEVQSVSGDVTLGIPSGTNVDLDARSASGSLDSEIPLSDSPTGEGGPAVVIRGNTVSGDIRVVRAVQPSEVGAQP